jgi:hypothetical protein
MAVARTATALSIDEWAAILGISPWDVNQFRYPGTKSAQCQDVLYQYAWQKDHLAREEIADAISDAEAMLAAELMYHPAPHYSVDEVIPYPRPHQRQLFGYAGDIRGDWKTFGTRWHKVIQGGVFNRTAIATIAGADLVASDLDGDGIKETFTATITNATIGTLTDPYEVALYFASGDRHGEPLDETWRIRPIRVSIAGNVATITGHRTILVKPTPQYGVTVAELDATVDTNYVTSVECYRVFTDDTATAALPYQGVAIWKNNPDCTQDCTFSIKELCLGESQNEQGQIFASFGDTCDWPFPDREPDRLEINYVSGVPLVNGRMDRLFAQMVTYLSVSLLANNKCGCDRTNSILTKLRSPVLKFQDKSADATSFAESTNAFPMTYGAQWAWARVNANRHVEVVSI